MYNEKLTKFMRWLDQDPKVIASMNHGLDSDQVELRLRRKNSKDQWEYILIEIPIQTLKWENKYV